MKRLILRPELEEQAHHRSRRIFGNTQRKPLS
jgi:hypothetical protein